MTKILEPRFYKIDRSWCIKWHRLEWLRVVGYWMKIVDTKWNGRLVADFDVTAFRDPFSKLVDRIESAVMIHGTHRMPSRSAVVSVVRDCKPKITGFA